MFLSTCSLVETGRAEEDGPSRADVQGWTWFTRKGLSRECVCLIINVQVSVGCSNKRVGAEFCCGDGFG